MQNTVTREVSNTAIAIRQSSVRRWDALICSCVVRTEYASPVAMQAYIPTSMDDKPLMERNLVDFSMRSLMSCKVSSASLFFMS